MGNDAPNARGTCMAQAGEEGRASKTRRGERPRRSSSASGASRTFGLARLRTAADVLLHARTPDERVWRWFWPILALAFAVRAAVALSGDFFIHADEIMQHLEQGHRLAFGNGVIYWEFFYGGRSWLLPGLIAGMLKLFDAAGFGQPAWYVDGVKLIFCGISLLIPAGMYFFARRHFNETTARTALLAGAFWYELVVCAHKPMTEFVATALLLALLALCLPFPHARAGPQWLGAFLAVLAASVRMQYAPLALALLGLCFLRARKSAKMQLVLAATMLVLAVGLFDAVTWDSGFFHSFRTNFDFNLKVDYMDSYQWGNSQYLMWLLYTGGGLSALCAVMALRDPRRYGFLLILVILILLAHSVQPRKEYRFVFVVAPLWLLIGADIVTRLAAHPPVRSSMRPSGNAWRPLWTYGTAGTLFAVVSLAGTMSATSRFARDRGPLFDAYRYLAAAPGVEAVWQADHWYLDTPGYYYLHRRIPFYDRKTGRANNLHEDAETLHASVSHIVTGDPNSAFPGYALEREFGDVRILRRDRNETPVRQWQDFTPTVIMDFAHRTMRQVDPDAPPPPANFGIRFVSRKERRFNQSEQNEGMADSPA